MGISVNSNSKQTLVENLLQIIVVVMVIIISYKLTSITVSSRKEIISGSV